MGLKKRVPGSEGAQPDESEDKYSKKQGRTTSVIPWMLCFVLLAVIVVGALRKESVCGCGETKDESPNMCEPGYDTKFDVPPEQRGRYFVCDDSEMAFKLLARMPDMIRVEDARNADLCWMRNDQETTFEKIPNTTWINYLPDDYSIWDKGKLMMALHAYDKTKAEGDRPRLKDFYRDTWGLYDHEECTEFFKQLPAANKAAGGKAIWIVKPVQSSQGDGIRILDDGGESLAKVYWDATLGLCHFKPKRSFKKGDDIDGKSNMIVQSYITNPLLLRNRKSEIRMYWLLASVNPLLVLAFREGTVRLTSKPYSLDDVTDRLAHITNVKAQKAEKGFDKTAILKWNFTQFTEYLAAEKQLSPTYIREVALPRVKEALVFSVNASRERLLENNPQPNIFDLYGADFIFDDELRPYLTELQLGPGLDYQDDTKRVILPLVFHEMIRVMREVRHRKLHNLSLAHLDAMMNFEWIINEAASPPFYFSQ